MTTLEEIQHSTANSIRGNDPLIADILTAAHSVSGLQRFDMTDLDISDYGKFFGFCIAYDLTQPETPVKKFKCLGLITRYNGERDYDFQVDRVIEVR